MTNFIYRRIKNLIVFLISYILITTILLSWLKMDLTLYIIITIIYLCYKWYKGTFTKIILEYKIFKKFGSLYYFERIDLTDKSYLDIVKEEFDKDILNYKEWFLCFTNSELVIIGYKNKNKSLEKIYIKNYKLENINNIKLLYEHRSYTTTQYRTETKQRKVTNMYGNSYVETIEEKVPYTKNNDFLYFDIGCIYFKNLVIERLPFDVKYVNHSKKLKPILKDLEKTCKKLCIKCDVQVDR